MNGWWGVWWGLARLVSHKPPHPPHLEGASTADLKQCQCRFRFSQSLAREFIVPAPCSMDSLSDTSNLQPRSSLPPKFCPQVKFRTYFASFTTGDCFLYRPPPCLNFSAEQRARQRHSSLAQFNPWSL